MGILIRRRRLPTTMLVLILGILHTVLSAAAFALYGYFLGNGTYDALSSFQKTSFIGQIVSVWGLFQGATAVQLVQQHFSEGSATAPAASSSSSCGEVRLPTPSSSSTSALEAFLTWALVEPLLHPAASLTTSSLPRWLSLPQPWSLPSSSFSTGCAPAERPATTEESSKDCLCLQLL